MGRLVTTFYHKKENVEEYIKISKGFDGSDLIEELKNHLASDSSLLELGMGEGKDLDILANTYKVTGSDYSDAFLNLYKEKNPDSDLVQLDAITLQINKKFDGIYSNKVLHHLHEDELKQSISRQAEILNPNGVILHSFWRGSGIEEFDEMFAMHYMENDLIPLFEKEFKILEIRSYKEMEEDDSLFIVAQKRS
ncbi:MAG: class I SAM-dependent methyltransferase [bacterium]|nr:class I SAM-dependent methyltransferase [bacterium]